MEYGELANLRSERREVGDRLERAGIGRVGDGVELVVREAALVYHPRDELPVPFPQTGEIVTRNLGRTTDEGERRLDQAVLHLADVFLSIVHRMPFAKGWFECFEMSELHSNTLRKCRQCNRIFIAKEGFLSRSRGPCGFLQ